MAKYIFPKGFLWGTATASYQIEGGVYEDGKGETVWDRFTHTPGTIYQNQNGDIACDHYHRWKEDVEIMKFIGLNAYRFSISWARIFPEGKGSLNLKGLNFYRELIETLLSKNIKPAITLYHWDLPQALEDKGGWLNRDTSKYFSEYANFMFKTFREYDIIWITLNEPWVHAFLGYGFGVHAPGKRDMKGAFIASHNLLLAHGLAVQSFFENRIKGQIGISLNLSPIHPGENTPEDWEAVQIQDGFVNRWFLDPLFYGKYPEDIWKILEKNKWAFNFPLDDFKTINLPFDFIGVNYYTRSIVKKDPENSFLGIKFVSTEKEKTEMGWEIYPKGLYELLIRLKKDYPRTIYITENGAAFNDLLEYGIVKDEKRINYLKEHIKEAYNALKDGVDLRGYFVWSLMDNFEWAHGYSKRFGIVYIDYKTQKRILKDSAYFYKKVIEQNGLED
ncbi:MAG: GH1 family beta-glucosidase [Dictyoglomaceae bacterium]